MLSNSIIKIPQINIKHSFKEVDLILIASSSEDNINQTLSSLIQYHPNLSFKLHIIDITPHKIAKKACYFNLEYDCIKINKSLLYKALNKACDKIKGDGKPIIIIGDQLTFINNAIDGILNQLMFDRVGVVGSQMLLADQRVKHQSIGLVKHNLNQKFIFENINYNTFKYRYDITKCLSNKIECMAFKKGLWKEINHFNESLQFLNDIEFNIKAHLKGFDNYIVNSSIVYDESYFDKDCKESVISSIKSLQPMIQSNELKLLKYMRLI